MNEYILFDLETNGLNPNTIFVACIVDLISRERSTYVGVDEVAEAIMRIVNAKMLVGHYIKGFDLKVIKKLVDVDVSPDVVVDTLDLSRKYYDGRLKNHKLETWGEKIGYPKLKQPIFEHFTPEMIPYCERDVDLNVRMFDILVDEYQASEQIKPSYHAKLDEYISVKAEHQKNPTSSNTKNPTSPNTINETP